MTAHKIETVLLYASATGAGLASAALELYHRVTVGAFCQAAVANGHTQSEAQKAWQQAIVHHRSNTDGNH